MTKTLVLGDFGAAISLYLSTEQYANAILLAVNEGPDSKALFEKCTLNLLYFGFSSPP